jgi:putative oxidoreductase
MLCPFFPSFFFMFFHSMERRKDCALLLLRLAIAGAFLAHGYMKWTNFDTLPTIMKILAIAEPLGGAALILGALSRWAALGLIIIMLGAIYTKMFSMGVGYAEGGKMGWEFDALLLAANYMILSVGAGKYSLDSWIGWEKPHTKKK